MVDRVTPAAQRAATLAGVLLGLLALLVAIASLGCASTPAPLPQPTPAPRVIVERIPVYDPCPPPANLPRPILWPLLVDGIQAPDLATKLLVIQQVGQSWQWWGDDEAGQLDLYRGTATQPLAPAPTPAPR